MTCSRVNSLENQDNQHTGERGSAIIWVLVFCALFVALSFAVSQGMRGGGEDISREKAGLAASEAIDYGRAVKDMLQQMRVGGCTETEFSFDLGGPAGYVNAAAPSDKTCHLYQAQGGGLRWLADTGDIGGTVGFSGSMAVAGVGTAASELMLTWQGIDRTICEAINTKLGFITDPAPPATTDDTCDLGTAGCKFTGSYPATATITNSNNAFDGRMNGCYNEDDEGTNFVFYQVLISR